MAYYDTLHSEHWKKISPDEIIDEIKAMRKKLESIQPVPIAFAGEKVYEAMERKSLYDLRAYGIRKNSLLPDNIVYIPAKCVFIQYEGDI